MNFDKNYYEILGVLPSSEARSIKAAYKALAQRYHPDKLKEPSQAAENKMKELNEAFSILSDVKKRKKYDDYLNKKNEKNKPHEGTNSYQYEATQSEWDGSYAQEDVIKTKIFTPFLFFSSFSIILFFCIIIFLVNWYQNTNYLQNDKSKKPINKIVKVLKKEEKKISVSDKKDKTSLSIKVSIDKEREKQLIDKFPYYDDTTDDTPRFVSLKSFKYLNHLISTTEFNLPIPVKKDILWKKMTAREGAIVYHYYFTNDKASHFSPQQVFNTSSVKNKKQTCDNLNFHLFLEQGVRYIYIYYGNDDKYIIETSVSLEDCKALSLSSLKSKTVVPTKAKSFQRKTLKRKKVPLKIENIKPSCYFKPVMTNEDYLNCGLTPPK